MGLNTTILILNDGLNTIQNNPKEFTDKLCDAISSGKEQSISIGNYGNPVYIMPTAHADIPRLYATRGNSITELSSVPRDKRDSYQKFWFDMRKWARSILYKSKRRNANEK
jgi:isoleucyl-tRNA synthetase